jgi:hypothetical protein
MILDNRSRMRLLKSTDGDELREGQTRSIKPLSLSSLFLSEQETQKHFSEKLRPESRVNCRDNLLIDSDWSLLNSTGPASPQLATPDSR